MQVLCLIPAADPRLVVIHDPDYPWSEAPLTFMRDSRYLVMPALNQRESYMEGDNFVTSDRKGRKVAMMYDLQVHAGPCGASLAHIVCNRVAVGCFTSIHFFDVTTWEWRSSDRRLLGYDCCDGSNNSCCMSLVAASPARDQVACMVKGRSSLHIFDAVTMQRLRRVRLAGLDHATRGGVNNLAWVLHGWLLSTTITSFPPEFQSIHVFHGPKSEWASPVAMQTLQY